MSWPGECVATARIHLGYLFGDDDAVAQATHDHLRKSVIPTQAREQALWIEYNHSGHSGNAPIKEAVLREEIETAGEVGCELFMVDAGWFGDATKACLSEVEPWRQMVGDWGRRSVAGRYAETGL